MYDRVSCIFWTEEVSSNCNLLTGITCLAHIRIKWLLQSGAESLIVGSINREGTHYPHNNHLLTEEGLRNVFQSCQLCNVRFREPAIDQVPTIRLKDSILSPKTGISPNYFN